MERKGSRELLDPQEAWAPKVCRGSRDQKALLECRDH